MENTYLNKLKISRINTRLANLNRPQITDTELSDLISKAISRNNKNTNSILPANKALNAATEFNPIGLNTNGSIYIGSKVFARLSLSDLRQAETNLKLVQKPDCKNDLKIINEVAILELMNLIPKPLNSLNIYEQVQQLLIHKYNCNFINSGVGYTGNLVAEFIVEARNNSALWIDIDQLNNAKSTKEVLRIVANHMVDFNAETEFNEIWSPNFGKHNQFKPSQFLKMLKKKIKNNSNLQV